MKVESSTSLIPVLNVTSYGDYVYEDFWFNRETIEQCILENAPEFVEDHIKEYVPSATISNFSVYMPREYNFYGDDLNFDIEIPDAEYQRMYNDALNDPEFATWLQRYSSRSGFISFMADNIKDFQTQKDIYTVAQLVSYACREYIGSGELDYDYEDAIREWAWNNVPPCEDELANGYTIGSDYGVSFSVWDGDEQLAEFEVAGDTTKDYWDAYDKAYEYAMSLTGDM